MLREQGRGRIVHLLYDCFEDGLVCFSSWVLDIQKRDATRFAWGSRRRWWARARNKSRFIFFVPFFFFLLPSYTYDTAFVSVYFRHTFSETMAPKPGRDHTPFTPWIWYGYQVDSFGMHALIRGTRSHQPGETTLTMILWESLLCIHWSVSLPVLDMWLSATELRPPAIKEIDFSQVIKDGPWQSGLLPWGCRILWHDLSVAS